MEEIKCNQVGMLSGGKWDKLHDTNRRVYALDGLSPALTTMGGGQREVKILVAEATIKGYDEAEYEDSINIAFPNSKTRCGRVGHGIAQTITATNMDQVAVEPLALDEQNGYIRQDGIVGTLTTDGSSPKHNNRIVEPICLNSKVDGKQPSLTDRVYDTNGISTCVTTSPSYRIRKLTERECFRLMGVKESDYDKVAKNQSMSSRYHLAGDSIVTTCLMAIFGELLSIDYKTKINELVEELKQ